ncbi:MAG: HAD family hydrolase [Eubacteriales bacterium]|nr:HAD family hydrolase [Eubacteriales bacterium]
MNRKYLLFDLDGTLTDSEEGITKCVAYALEHFGIHETDQGMLRKFIGPPLMDSFMEYYGFSEEMALEATEKYRERFGKIGLFENTVYEGIPQLLAELQASGKKLILATSKPLMYAKKIMERHGLAKYFYDMQGPEMDGTRNRKEEVVAYALQVNHIEDVTEAVMIGDRLHDIVGARACGLDCIGVLYGFGDREELEHYGATQIVETVEELGRILEI